MQVKKKAGPVRDSALLSYRKNPLYFDPKRSNPERTVTGFPVPAGITSGFGSAFGGGIFDSAFFSGKESGQRLPDLRVGILFILRVRGLDSIMQTVSLCTFWVIRRTQ